MRLSRLRSGERLALLGAIALAVMLGLDWYFLSTPDARVGAHESGIRSIGWLAALILVAAIASALTLAFVTVTQRAATAHPVVFSVLTFWLGVLAVVTILVRLVWQPHLGVDAGRADVEVELPAYLALISALALTAGGFLTMMDERTDMPEAIEQTDEAIQARGDNPRPAPPPTTPGRSGPADALADPANP
jgi:hypothetical protein